MKRLSVAMGVVALIAASAAGAAIVVDESPNAEGLTVFQPGALDDGNPRFLVELTLSQETRITGIDIYSPNNLPVGTKADVILRYDNGSGQPKLLNAFNAETTISAIDTDGATGVLAVSRFHADFSGPALNAGTYWIGMDVPSGIEWSIAYPVSAPYTTWGLYGYKNLYYLGNSIAFPYRVYGVPSSSTPEPATWAMMLLGFGFVGASMRRRLRLSSELRSKPVSAH